MTNNIILRIDCIVQSPKGINFIRIDGKEPDDPTLYHAYTYRTAQDSSTFEWLPCIDKYYNYSLFEINIIVPKGWSALATGEHIVSSVDLFCFI